MPARYMAQSLAEKRRGSDGCAAPHGDLLVQQTSQIYIMHPIPAQAW